MESGLRVRRLIIQFPPLFLFLLLFHLRHVGGYSMYRDRIPNGHQVPHPCKPNYRWQGVGHTNPLGGGARNVFGADFLRLGARWNTDLCQLDSDEDGHTNGQELGDPDCVWKEGDLPTRTSSITHPGVCDPWEKPECQTYNAWIDCDTGTLDCPALDNEPDIMNLTLRFPPTEVPSRETNYMCMTFDLPGDDVYDIVATQPYIDNAQVMHHMLLFSCEGAKSPPLISSPVPCGMADSKCYEIVGGWTVGSPGDCMPETCGFRFGKDRYTRVLLQTHWNNPELRNDYVDSSGLVVHYTRRLRDNSATTLVVGQRQFHIPPRQPSVQITGTCPSDCSRILFAKPFYVVQAMNHMHYLGKREKIEVFRQGRLVSNLTNEDTYSYDSPVNVHHNPPIEVRPGDEIKVTCEYNSLNSNHSVYYGDGTSDEMCYGFLNIYPQEAVNRVKYCTAFGEMSICDRFNIGGGDSGDRTDQPPTSGDDVIEGCQWRQWTNTNSAEFQGLAHRLSESCSAFGSCRRECGLLVERLTRHPCLHGNAWERVKSELLESHVGLMVLAYIDSCPLVFCPLCQRCD